MKKARLALLDIAISRAHLGGCILEQSAGRSAIERACDYVLLRWQVDWMQPRETKVTAGVY